MWTILGVLIVGIALGFILREKLSESFLSKLLLISIYLLLFLLGVEIGNNPRILKNLSSLGWQAIAFTFATVIGSLLCIIIIYKLFLHKRKVN